MKTQTNFQKREYLKRASAYINFAITLIGIDFSPTSRFNIAQFKMGYQLADLMDYSNDEALDILIGLGKKLIKQILKK